MGTMQEKLEQTPQQAEQRLTFRLLSYWQRARGEREFPALADIRISEITELWHYTFTIALGRTQADHRFQYFGPRLATSFKNDYTGETVVAAMEDNLYLYNTIGFYADAVVRRGPVSESDQFMLDGQEVRHRSLIVPLATDGETIDYLMGTTNFKIFGG